MTKHPAYNSSSCYSGSEKKMHVVKNCISEPTAYAEICGQEMPTPEEQPSIDSQVSYLWGVAFIKAVDSLLKDFFSPASGSP